MSCTSCRAQCKSKACFCVSFVIPLASRKNSKNVSIVSNEVPCLLDCLCNHKGLCFQIQCSSPVNKVIRNNRTRSKQNGRKVTSKTTSPEQRSLGKDRVCFPRCAQLTSQYNKVTQLIMPSGATVPFPVSFLHLS